VGWKVACGVALLSAWGSAAQAQATDRPRPRIEFDIGGGSLGGAALCSGDANVLANTPARQPFRIFSADTRMARAGALHARAGVALSRRFGVEAGVVLGHPEVRTSLSADVENAPPLTVVERIDQYFFEASVIVMFEQWRVGRGTVPFAAAGAGYLRQLHEGLTVVEQGHLYHAGGGVKHWLVARDRGRVRTAGLRADARLYVLARGVSLDEGPRPHTAISGSVFVGF
jgi:hypothetical protein